jgi:hypothetical protein
MNIWCILWLITHNFTGDFASWTVHFVNNCVKNQQIHQLFIQFINFVWYLLHVSALHAETCRSYLLKLINWRTNWCIGWLFTHILLVILIFKRLSTRRICKSFGVKGLILQTATIPSGDSVTVNFVLKMRNKRETTKWSLWGLKTYFKLPNCLITTKRNGVQHTM